MDPSTGRGAPAAHYAGWRACATATTGHSESPNVGLATRGVEPQTHGVRSRVPVVAGCPEPHSTRLTTGLRLSCPVKWRMTTGEPLVIRPS